MPHFRTSDGVQLHYTRDGSGVPVLCLAGLTRNGRDFDHVAPHLAGAQVIRLDYRGRGQSDWADPATYSIPVEARDVVELLDHLGLDRVAILGTSRGGLIAMLLAATAKSRLLGVCLNDVGPVIDPRGLDYIKGYLGRRPAERTLDELAHLWARSLAGFPGVPVSRWRAEAGNRYLETSDGLDLRYDAALREAVLSAGAQPAPDLWPLFDALSDLPAALIRGANSNLLAPDVAGEMRRRHPDMIFAEVPDRGHVPFLDEPESLAALGAWLERLT